METLKKLLRIIENGINATLLVLVGMRMPCIAQITLLWSSAIYEYQYPIGEETATKSNLIVLNVQLTEVTHQQEKVIILYM